MRVPRRDHVNYLATYSGDLISGLTLNGPRKTLNDFGEFIRKQEGTQSIWESYKTTLLR